MITMMLDANFLPHPKGPNRMDDVHFNKQAATERRPNDAQFYACLICNGIVWEGVVDF